MLVAMAVGALVFAVGAQTRPSNKTANAVNIGFLDVGNVVTADQFYFGMLMAGNEINANATILQDVTLTFPRIRMQSATTRPAAVYDSVASLCDSGQYRAFLCSINTNNTLTYSYPLFYRSQTPLTPNILTMIAMFRYFGWKKTGIVYGASGLYPETNDASKQMFPAYGIQVLTSIKIPDYDSTISTLYYPQIKAQFDFLAQTKLRIFCAYFDTAVVLDVAMAANRTGLIGRDYGFLVPSFSTAPNPADPYYAAFFPRFQTFATWTIANQAGLYRDINFGQTDSRQQDYPRNFFYGDPPTDSIPAQSVIFAYDVTRALAYTLEQIIVDAQTTGAALANGSLASAITLAKLTKDYTTKPMLVTIPAFTPQGDPLPNPLIIVELQGKSFTDVYDTVASVSLDPVTGNGNMTIDKSKFFWNGNRSLSDVPIDSMPDKEDFVKTSDTIVVVMLALFVIVKEKSQFIRLFSPRLLAGISIGLALMQVNSFLLVGKNKPVGCALRPWPVPVGVSVVLASIVAKNLRIISVFAFSMSRMLSLFDRLKKIHIIAIHTVLILVPMILLAVVTAISPMTSDAVYANWLDGYQYTCVASAAVNAAVAAVVVWIALLMIGTWVLCYLNSGLPDAYNDTIESAGSAAIILLLGALAFLAGASPATATSAFALEMVCTAVAGVTVLMLMLGKPVMNCIVEEILGGRRVNKAARVRTKRSSRSGGHSASSHSQVTSVTSDSSFKVSKSSVAAINPKSSEIASDKQGPERQATLETEAMSQEVQIDISRHRISIAIHAMMLDTELLPQWRAAAIHLFPTPVMMIRVSTNRASKAIDAIEYLPFAELTGFKLRTDEPNRDMLKDTHIVTSLTLQDQAPVESKALVVRQPHPAWASVTRLLRSTSLDDNTKARLAAGKLHRGELLKLLSSAAASARANRSICDDDIERIMDDVGDGLFALRGRIMDERLSAEAGDGTPSDDKQGSLVRTNPAQEQMFRTVKSALKGSAESRESAIAMLDVLVKQVDRGLWVPKFNQIEDTINDTSTLAEFVGILAKRRDAKSTGVRAVTRFLTANRLVIASTVVSVARAATEIAPIPGLSAALGILNEIIQSMNEGWDAQRIMQAISARVNEVKEIILANMRRVGRAQGDFGRKFLEFMGVEIQDDDRRGRTAGEPQPNEAAGAGGPQTAGAALAASDERRSLLVALESAAEIVKTSDALEPETVTANLDIITHSADTLVTKLKAALPQHEAASFISRFIPKSRFEVASTILTVAKKAADFVPIPGIGVALSMIETVLDNVRDNFDAVDDIRDFCDDLIELRNILTPLTNECFSADVRSKIGELLDVLGDAAAAIKKGEFKKRTIFVVTNMPSKELAGALASFKGRIAKIKETLSYAIQVDSAVMLMHSAEKLNLIDSKVDLIIRILRPRGLNVRRDDFQIAETPMDHSGTFTVYAAKMDNEAYVIKEFNAALDEVTRDAVEDEARKWFPLSHSNLLRLSGICVDGDEKPFVALPFIEHDLESFLAANPAADVEVRMRVLTRVARALNDDAAMSPYTAPECRDENELAAAAAASGSSNDDADEPGGSAPPLERDVEISTKSDDPTGETFFVYDHETKRNIPKLRLEWDSNHCLTALRLTGSGLSGTIPKEIGRLTQLRELYVYRTANELEGSIPKDICKLPFLKSLLSGTLPYLISRLVCLEELVVCDNLIDALPETLADLENLRILDLGKNKIEAIPPELGRLSNLEILRIGGTMDDRLITEVPSEIGEMASLVELNLLLNNLTELPAQIGELRELRLLNVGCNMLTTLPPAIGNLKHLETLFAHWNTIEELPREIGSLKQMEHLNLAHNSLVHLPREIGNLRQLEILELELNSIKELPSEMGNLDQLIKLNLSRNELKSVHDQIGSADQLIELKLSHNHLTALPESFEDLDRLEILDVHGNKLEQLPNSLCESSNLKWLNASQNKLEFLPEGIGALSRLEWL
nr:hypothetical protein HK105_003092 [Polyrhizophydium stewartii]